jgi:hypothetical protein
MIRDTGRRKKATLRPVDDGITIGAGEGQEMGGEVKASPPIFIPEKVGHEESGHEALSPLDVMLRAMRRKWRQGDHEGAASLAKVAAPYVHPKISGGAHMARDDGSQPIQGMSDAELDLIVTSGKAERSDKVGRGGSGIAGATDDPAVVAELGDGGIGAK